MKFSSYHTSANRSHTATYAGSGWTYNCEINENVSQQKNMIITTNDEMNTMKLFLNNLINDVIEKNIQFVHVN